MSDSAIASVSVTELARFAEPRQSAGPSVAEKATQREEPASARRLSIPGEGKGIKLDIQV